MDHVLDDKGTVHLGELGSFRVTTSRRRSAKFGSKGLVYVTAPDPADLGLATTPDSHHSDDGGLNDQAWKAFNRLEVQVMKTFVEHAVAGKLTFSKKAGCSCGCSPGFRTDARSLRGWTTWVTAEAV
jgi:hypothetical protein